LEDVAAAGRYAEQQSAAVARSFLGAVQSALARIEQFPGIGSSRFEQLTGIVSLRFVSTGRFPNLVFYLTAPQDTIDVIRVLRRRQDHLSLLL
jgi:plasmid stabilization system protein ParE